MNRVVLDASALLAVLFREPGAEQVHPHLPNAMMSAVNLSEVATRMLEEGVPLEKVVEILARQTVEVISFDVEQSYVAASLRPATRKFGLSFGDRACLALGLEHRLPVLTGDRNWSECEAGVEVIQIR